MSRAYGMQALSPLEKPYTVDRLALLLGRLTTGLAPGPEPSGDGPGLTSSDVRRALHDDEFYVGFQPIVDFATGRVCGCEALARWHPPGWADCFPPSRFMPIIEGEGWVQLLTDRVLLGTAEKSAAWRRSHLDVDVSMNLTTHDVENVSRS